MKTLDLLVSFSPWLIFAALVVYTPVPFEITLLASLAASLLVGYRDLRDRFIIAWTTTLFFAVVSVLVLVIGLFEIVPLLGVASNGVLLLVTVGSLLAGAPFTEQYARREVSEEEWTDPFFLRLNRQLTVFWGLMFVVGLTSEVLYVLYPGALGVVTDICIWLPIVGGAVFSARYPDYAEKRASLAGPASVLR
ncbi:hypothetical protein F8E02_07665 [Methanoculleus sp. Wushi-C6]|uniref:Intracellular septation protein A n=1 Tax=Methanoculleus caldifontis TaxID=2651577 RepID=A0ABU3X1F2_9EURY|nr:hypothetical protein [Methanoculleus sp. Wushi-C6]MDV2481887.1 hypothetical protein [Methanoculleus sp. Wushi-C6]